MSATRTMVQVEKSELDAINAELARLAEILGHQVAATHHVTEQLASFRTSLDAVSGEIHDTHRTMQAMRAQQIREAQQRADAEHLREIADREARAASDTDPSPAPNGRGE